MAGRSRCRSPVCCGRDPLCSSTTLPPHGLHTVGGGGGGGRANAYLKFGGIQVYISMSTRSVHELPTLRKSGINSTADTTKVSESS